MVRLKIWNLDTFLQAVAQCRGSVTVRAADGRRADLCRDDSARQALRGQRPQKGGALTLDLDFEQPGDYLRTVCRCIGGC